MTGNHETKLVFDNRLSPTIVGWLRARCAADPQFPENCVSSIYFDDRNWSCLREKLNGDFTKKKVRLRWYSDVDDRHADGHGFLEVKFRLGGTRTKVRMDTRHSGEWLSRVGLDSPDLLAVPQLLRSKNVVLRRQLFPALLIRYKRRRFVEPTTGLRVSVDHDVCAPRVNPFMVPRVNPLPLPHAVVEIKGDTRELPRFLRQLTALGCRKRSFSKYSACYKQIMRIE